MKTRTLIFRLSTSVILLLLCSMSAYANSTKKDERKFTQNETDQAINAAPNLPFVPGSFTLAVLPDTQKYHKRNAKHFFSQTKWIAKNASKYNIAYVIFLGDITNNNTPAEWKNAKKAIDALDKGGIPYSLAYGNHDYYMRKADGSGFSANKKNGSLGNKYFKPEDFKKWPTFGQAMEKGKMDNNYHLFEANGTRFIILSVEWAPSDKALSWADEMLNRYPDRKAIFITHAYLYHDNTRYDRNKKDKQSWRPPQNDGEMIWQKLLKKHKNVILVLCGHVKGDGLGQLTSTGENGNKVHQILVNYQMNKEGGSGFLRLIEFLPDGKTLQLKSYSPSLNEYKTDSQNQFTLKL